MSSEINLVVDTWDTNCTCHCPACCVFSQFAADTDRTPAKGDYEAWLADCKNSCGESSTQHCQACAVMMAAMAAYFNADFDTEPAVKHDQGKSRWSLFPWLGAGEVMRVIEFGALKYAPGNWLKVLQEAGGEERYLDAAMRHLVARLDGETYDPESGLPHVAHATCCLLFVLSRPEEP